MTSSIQGTRHYLLPNEPRLIDVERQAELTARYLQPSLTALEAFFLEIRWQIDAQLASRYPFKMGKPYPYARCLEITLQAQQELKKLDPTEFSSLAAQVGCRAFLAFRRAGGVVRQVWGDLRGEFFQNAFQIGSLYVDVSNDTVTPSKPKVEILPFNDARFTPVRDFEQFIQIAQKYWNVQVFPNFVVPQLAPYCPLIYCSSDGRLMFGEATLYMTALAEAGRFYPSEQVLRFGVMPESVFKRVYEALTGWPKLATDADSGRRAALQACRDLRGRIRQRSKHRLQQQVDLAWQLNRRLLTATAAPIPIAAKLDGNQQIGSITIGERVYALAELSEEVRQQVQMLQFTEQHLRDLQRDLNIAQTARGVYLRALQDVLPQA